MTMLNFAENTACADMRRIGLWACALAGAILAFAIVMQPQNIIGPLYFAGALVAFAIPFLLVSYHALAVTNGMREVAEAIVAHQATAHQPEAHQPEADSEEAGQTTADLEPDQPDADWS